MFPLLKTGQVIDKNGGKIFLAERQKGRVVRKFAQEGLRVDIFDKLPGFADSQITEKAGRPEKIISFNGEILEILRQENPKAKELLFDLAFHYEEEILEGVSEEQALEKLLIDFTSRAEGERKTVLEALHNPGLDPDHNFRDFLEKGPHSPAPEKARLKALLRARILTDIPYARRQAAEVEKRLESDLPALRLETLNILSQTYEPSVDSENAQRVFQHCLKNDKKLLVCRFGRAFYTDALLIAEAKGIKSEEVRSEISSLREEFRKFSPLEGALKIGPELERIINLSSKDWSSQASLEGALEKLKNNLRDLETDCIKEFDLTHAAEHLQAARSFIDKFRISVHKLERRIKEANKFDPAFVAFISRLHELDAINVVRVNELWDPFFGENPKMEALITSTGHNSTISPNPGAWLRYASDWVEALPAYAHYVIVPQDQGGYQVVALTEREILEIIYKSAADDWARNIQDVIHRENVSVARKLVARRCGGPDDKEENVISYIQKHKKEPEVGKLALWLEKMANKDYRKLASLQEQGNSRQEALSLLAGSWKENPGDLKEEAKIQLYASLAGEKKRALPNVNVLTTLGPTETEINIANWLEEAMTLYLIEQEHGLEEEVRKKRNSYREVIGEIAWQVVREEEMEGELLRIMGEDGLKGEPRERMKVSLTLCSLYPEIAFKTNKKIAEVFPVLGPSAHGLRDFVGPLAKFTARREVIREKGLAKLIDDGRYRYASSGPYKRYHLAYTPSRVDLGPEIIESVRRVPKWVGGEGPEAAREAKALYSLFNLAGVTAVARTKVAEFLKVGENFFTRGGVYYLSLTAGANIDTLGLGDFEFLQAEWNQRGDRKVLPTGETYGGFCVPKEFSLLFAIITRALNPETIKEIFDSFGIPADKSTREKLLEDMLPLIKMRRQASSLLEWEEKAGAYLAEHYGEYLPRLPQLAMTLNKAGVVYEDAETRHSYLITNWKNKKALGLEEINRSGVFDKVRLINRLVKESQDKNPHLSPDKLIGVLAAGYKEDVTDVRFSSGARKLEVFAGLSGHLLEDIDPEGREIYGPILSSYPSPLDIRLVGMCTAKDMFGHVPMDFSSLANQAKEDFLQAGYTEEWIAHNALEHGLDLESWSWNDPEDEKKLSRATLPFLVYGNNLAQMAEAVKRRFFKYGLTEEVITANAVSFGGDLSRWKGLKEKDKQALVKEIGALKHIFVTEARGIYSKERYEAALTGADWLDLGIPDRELLDLLDNLPKLVYLMKNGRDKPLYFADGTSGARRFAFSFRYSSAKEKVKELFALEEQSYYGCLGIGKEEIELWKEEMLREREEAQLLLTLILEKRLKEADKQWDKILRCLRDREIEEEYIQMEIKARQLGVWEPYYRYASARMSAITRGISLKELDFASFLLLGGRWLFNGKVSGRELEQIENDYIFALEPKTFREGREEIIEHCFQPKYFPETEEYKEVSTEVSGSLKAVEELTLKLETREIRREQLEAAQRLSQRRAAFQKEIVRSTQGIEKNYAAAVRQISPEDMSEERLGRFLALTKKVWLEIIESFLKPGRFQSECRQELESTFRGGNLLDAEYTSLAIKGGRLFELVNHSEKHLREIALALELLDIAYLIEKTFYQEGVEVWKALAQFFDNTLNNHVFDYIPYHYHSQRTFAFKDWAREKLLQFTLERHLFLHQFILKLVKNKSHLADKPDNYVEALLGKFDAENNLLTPALGINIESAWERQWFSYARLRDLATLIFDGYPLPEIREDEQIKDGINIGVVYPLGNTTISVALEQGPKFSSEGVNLFLVPFPRIVTKGGRKLLVAQEIFFRNKQGAWILARLKEELVVHAVWFHFTHFLRPQIEKVGAPLIQPLLWEAATYLKCDLPEMLQGSGVPSPAQRNWHGKQSEELSPRQAKEQIEELISDLASRHRVLIVKAEKESGGRRARILPVRDKEGNYLLNNLKALTDLVYDISKTDNAVIQEVIPSKVRQLYTKDFLELLQERFITELGIGIQEDTPFFSYFRLVVVKSPDNKCAITHYITVVSTAGIANVGQGGRLFEYGDEIINPQYREDLREEIEHAALSSLSSQEKFIQAHRQRILDSYLKGHPEFSFDREILEPHLNALGRADHEILYEMGDYMCVLLTDEQGYLKRVYDREKERFISLPEDDQKGTPPDGLKIYDQDGKLQSLPVKLYEGNKKRKLFWQDEKGKKREVKSLTVVKIEPNPGAGLWRPHNDRLKLVNRDGEGVYRIFKTFSEWGKLYKEKIDGR